MQSRSPAFPGISCSKSKEKKGQHLGPVPGHPRLCASASSVRDTTPSRTRRRVADAAAPPPQPARPRPTPPHTPDRPAGPPTGAPRPPGRSGQLGTVPADAPVASTPPGRREPGGWARSAAFGPGAKKAMDSTDTTDIFWATRGGTILVHPLVVTGAGSTAPGPFAFLAYLG